MQSFSIACRECGTAVEVIESIFDSAKAHGILCEQCLRISQPPRANRKINLDKFCPPCFADTNIDRLPEPDKTRAALQWKFGPRGLNLWGLPGTGKTRTISLIISRELQLGRTIVVFGAGGFREECEARNYRRAPWLKHLAIVDLLVIDDFDKQNLTRSMEKDLFAVLSNRMGRRPVITTGNSNGDQIEKAFSLGAPMVDRIRRYCQSVHFGRELTHSHEAGESITRLI